jgi:hypothetical protein
MLYMIRPPACYHPDKCAIWSWFSETKVSLSFHCFENLTVLHAIQSWFSETNVPLSFRCFENLTVLHAIQSRSSDLNIPLSFHCFENYTVLHAMQVISGISTNLQPCQDHCFQPVGSPGPEQKYFKSINSWSNPLLITTRVRVILLDGWPFWQKLWRGI